MSDDNPGRGFLEDVQHGHYWMTMDGQWRHNTTRDVTDTDRVLLDAWAVCRPGGTAHLSDDGWTLLDATTHDERENPMTITEPAATMAGVHLYNIIDRLELAAALDAKLVREQTHPSEPLAILNYTDRCPVTPGAWNATTRACRGLIYRTDTGEVVARGWPKFFNHEQDGAPVIPLDRTVLVTDKKDGSLGILYPLPSGGTAVATRGSFASEQALHATALLHDRYRDYELDPAITTLVEIVYPQNRIVLDYAGMDDLVLLGGMPIAGGMPVPPASMYLCYEWPGPFTETLFVGYFAEALELPSRPDREGVVVQDLVTGDLIKIKEVEYVRLHKLVTGLTARTVWQHLLDGNPLEDLLAPLPDEFHPWVRQVAAVIAIAVTDESARLHRAFTQVVESMPVGWSPQMLPGDRAARAAFAKVAAAHPDKWALFALLDGRDIRPELLKRAQPGPFLTPTGLTHTEETA